MIMQFHCDECSDVMRITSYIQEYRGYRENDSDRWVFQDELEIKENRVYQVIAMCLRCQKTDMFCKIVGEPEPKE